jgi:ubiquinone biosynthesis accessory factor UbiJ
MSVFNDLAIRAINRLLQREQWARTRLQTHAGQTAAIELVGGPALQFSVTGEGLLDPLRSDALPPDVRISIAAQAVPSLLDGVDSLSRHAQIAGNAQFAETLQTLAKYLRPDIAAALSPFLGDMLAHRLDRTISSFASATGRSARNLGENLIEYLRDEKALFPRTGELETFAQAIARLRDDLARMEKRLDKLSTTVLH